jgi:hypothetical protein
MLALQAHTEPARRLLKRTKRDGDEATGASDEERLAAQIELQRTSPEPWRRKLLDEAAEAARDLYRWAVQAWTGGAQRSREEMTEDVMFEIDATGETYEQWLSRNPDMWLDELELPMFVGEEGDPSGFGGEDRGPRLSDERGAA